MSLIQHGKHDPVYGIFQHMYEIEMVVWVYGFIYLKKIGQLPKSASKLVVLCR